MDINESTGILDTVAQNRVLFAIIVRKFWFNVALLKDTTYSRFLRELLVETQLFRTKLKFNTIGH